MTRVASIRTEYPTACFPWDLFATIFALSAPLWVLASHYQFELMPGLPISALMFLVCPVVAMGFAWRINGPREVLRVLLRSFDFVDPPSRIWYAFALLLMPCVLAMTYFVMRFFSMPLPEPQISLGSVPLLLVLFLIAATAEELAWSGSVLDPLQSRWGTLRASLFIGAVSAIWHVVPFAQAGNSATWIAGQCLFTVVFRIVIVEIYNGSGKSVAATSVTHASYNVAWQLFPNRGSGYDPWVTTMVTAVAVTAFLVLKQARTRA